MMSLCYLRPGRVVPSRVMPRYVVVLFPRVCCRAWPYNIYTLNRVLSAAKCCSANWLRILIYAIKCGTDFATLPKLKADAKIRTKIVLLCIVLECFSFMFVYELPKPNTTSFKHLRLLPHANPSAMIYASLLCATLLKGRSALSAQYTSAELVCLSLCVCVHVNLSTWVWIWYGQLPQYVTHTLATFFSLSLPT